MCIVASAQGAAPAMDVRASHNIEGEPWPA